MKRNPILFGQAEEFDRIRPRIQSMIDREGVYICRDVNQPGAEVPVVSIAGKLRAIKLDTTLDPERFLPTVRVSGPFRAWQSVEEGVPTHFHSVIGWVTGGPLVDGIVAMPFADFVSYDPEKNEWHQSLGTEDAIVPVSHWMPGPNAPD
jgi:hypothetical protein